MKLFLMETDLMSCLWMATYLMNDGNLLDEVVLDGNLLDELPMIRNLCVKFVRMMYLVLNK